MRFKRPKKPAGFDETVKAVRALVQDAVDKGQAPSFQDLWGDFKPFFAEAQQGKCGYCEIVVIGGQDGDVEHYAPKAELKMLGPDETTWGTEAPNSSRVRGRKPMPVSESGYWWLAYDWSNYLLSCAVCNQKWKKNLFPIMEPPKRTVPPTQTIVERSLLLSPFAGANPSKHLRFNADGSVMPRKGSRRGLETIKTVGLDRPSLRVARLPMLSDAYQALHEFADAKTDAEADRALRDLVRLGSDNRQFAGAVRTVVEQELAMSWKQVEAAAQA